MSDHELLTPAEVAVMFRVNPKTVTRWAKALRRARRLAAFACCGKRRECPNWWPGGLPADGLRVRICWPHLVAASLALDGMPCAPRRRKR